MGVAVDTRKGQNVYRQHRERPSRACAEGLSQPPPQRESCGHLLSAGQSMAGRRGSRACADRREEAHEERPHTPVGFCPVHHRPGVGAHDEHKRHPGHPGVFSRDGYCPSVMLGREHLQFHGGGGDSLVGRGAVEAEATGEGLPCHTSAVVKPSVQEMRPNRG